LDFGNNARFGILPVQRLLAYLYQCFLSCTFYAKKTSLANPLVSLLNLKMRANVKVKVELKGMALLP